MVRNRLLWLLDRVAQIRPVVLGRTSCAAKLRASCCRTCKNNAALEDQMNVGWSTWGNDVVFNPDHSIAGS